jgi:hemoglobin
MRTLIVVLLAVAAGCGGKAGKGDTAKKKAGTTCNDAATVLATKAGGTTPDERRKVAIAKACVADKWPADVIKCVVSWPEVEDCLVRLTEAQRQAYIRARVAAAEPVVPVEPVADEPVDDPYAGYGGYGSGYGMATIECEYALGDVAAYDPAITQVGGDRDFAMGLRRIALKELCDDGWSDEVRRCFADGYDVLTCRAKLDSLQEQELADKLAENENLLTRIGKLAVKPTSIECKKVVAVHYADAAWKGKQEGVKGKARKKMIAESRKAMTSACTDEAWSALMRACVVGDDTDQCMLAAGFDAARFGFPAAGVSAGGAKAAVSAGLFDRLGADEGIAMIVDTWIMTMTNDSRINAFFASADIGMLQSHLYDQMCELVGGPCKYSGKDMKSAHKGMGLTSGDVDAFLDDLNQALAGMGIDTKDRDEVVNLYKGMKGDVAP